MTKQLTNAGLTKILTDIQENLDEDECIKHNKKIKTMSRLVQLL